MRVWRSPLIHQNCGVNIGPSGSLLLMKHGGYILVKETGIYGPSTFLGQQRVLSNLTKPHGISPLSVK